MEPTDLATSVPHASSVALARRRRQARLRQSLHDVDSDIVMRSLDRWDDEGDSGHPEFEMISKRREANARERLRVRNLNSGFAKLRRILPTVSPNRKPSKVDTLQGAIDYIDQLEKVLDATGGIPNIKNTMGSSSHAHSRQSVTERPFLDSDEGQLPASLAVRYATPFSRAYRDKGADPYCCTHGHEGPKISSQHNVQDQNCPYPDQLHPISPVLRSYSYSDERSGESIFHDGSSYGIPSPSSSLTSDDSCERNHQLMLYEGSNYQRTAGQAFSRSNVTTSYDSKERSTPPEIVITSSDDTSPQPNCSPSTAWTCQYGDQESHRYSNSEEEVQWDADKSLGDGAHPIRAYNSNTAMLPPLSCVYRNDMSIDA